MRQKKNKDEDVEKLDENNNNAKTHTFFRHITSHL